MGKELTDIDREKVGLALSNAHFYLGAIQAYQQRGDAYGADKARKLALAAVVDGQTALGNTLDAALLDAPLKT